jgi:hypothetical protein
MDDALLSEELAAIAGVEDAELSFADGDVTGVRVRLEVDADPEGVGRAVQEVMTRHGVRARLGTQPPPPPVGSVVALADHSQGSTMAVQPMPSAEVAGVAISETTSGLEVTVRTADGREDSRRCLADDQSVAEAVTAATSELHDGEGAVLVEYLRHEVASHEIVTVVIDGGRDGHLAGSAIVGSGFPFAVARAVWAALGA